MKKVLLLFILSGALSFGAVPHVITWNDNSDNEDNFILQRRTAEVGSDWSDYQVLPSNSVMFEDTDLIVGVEYRYRVRAANAVGDSAYSNVGTAIAIAEPTVPSAPDGLAVTIKISIQIN